MSGAFDILRLSEVLCRQCGPDPEWQILLMSVVCSAHSGILPPCPFADLEMSAFNPHFTLVMPQLM